MNEIPSHHLSWLQSFYSAPGNDVSITDIGTERFPVEASEVIYTMLGAIDVEQERGCMIVVPVVRQNKVTGWFATIQNNNLEVDLVNAIQSWLGPSYNKLCEFVTHEVNDNRVGALRSVFKGPVLRFYGTEKSVISNKLLSYYGLLSQRPSFSKSRKRTIGEIRTDLEKALLIGDRLACSSLKDELFAAGRLSEQNKKFVEIQINAGLGEWKAIALNKPNLSTLADLYLPNNVISDLLESLFRTFIEDQAFASFTELMDTVKFEILAKYPGLFQNVQVTPNWRVNIIYLCRQLLLKSEDTDLIIALKMRLGDKFSNDWTPEYENILLELKEKKSVSPHVPSGSLEIVEHDYEERFSTLLKAEKTLSNLLDVVHCYLMLDSEDLVNEFNKYVTGVSEELIAKLPVGAQKTIRSAIKKTVLRDTPEGWLGWFQFANISGVNSEITEIIHNNYKNWQISDIVEAEQKFNDFISACEGLLESNVEIFQSHVAKISEVFIENAQVPAKKQIEIAKTLLMCLALVDQKTKIDLDVISSITFSVFALNPSAADYKVIMDILNELRRDENSYFTVDWQLEICECLAANRVPSDECHDIRQGYFLSTCNDLQRYAHRLSETQLRLVDFLSNDYDFLPDFVEEKLQEKASDESSSEVSLDGKVIGIYTLTESAGQRAKSFIETMYPGVTVKLSTDKVCSERLKGLSRSADIFLFTSKSSSHQAFYCIKDHATTEPIQVSGKGTSSILNALQAHL